MVLTQKNKRSQIEKAAAELGLKNIDELEIALKGLNKEYLFCDSNQIYIYKKGFLTGHFMGGQKYSMPYSNISSVSVNFTFISGYFEVSAGGMQGNKKQLFTSNSNKSSTDAPNTITLGEVLKKDFEEACNIINKMIKNNSSQSQTQSSLSPADEIKKYKSLLDDGTITQEEFDEKKKQLLNI